MTSEKKYKFILWDVDGTLIDFDKSEKLALKYCFSKFDLFPTAEDLEEYAEINRGYWRLLEQGLIEKKLALELRFSDFFEYLGAKNLDAAEMNRLYQSALGENCVMNDDALELCSDLKGNYKQYVVTNGTAAAQSGKLKNTGLGELMDGIFISEALGFEKPDVRFFDGCFEKITDFSKDLAIIIGDSLTSDMQGGNNAGIDCCWFDPKCLIAPLSLKIKYHIRSLKELRQIL